jgi:predicted chitinase
MSSGVGQQMSQRLTRLKFTVKNYGSLVIHNGNDDSKMHPTLRKQQPLESDFDNLNEEMKKLTSTQSFVDLLKLKGKVPDSVLLQLPIIINKLNCNSILRLSHFLAHCHYDTNGFNKTRKIDNPNSRHITKRVLSEKVYNHLQILEDKDLIKFSKIIGKNLIDNPSLVSNKYSLAASGYIFNMRNLWVICDYGFDEHITRSLTRRIYGSLNSLSGRYELFKYYYNLLK